MTASSAPLTSTSNRQSVARSSSGQRRNGPKTYAPGEPTWPLDHVVDVPPTPDKPVIVKNKTVILQIDGLGFAALQMADKMGLIPANVQKFFKENGYQFEPYIVGQPSTPCSESGIVFGSKSLASFVVRDPKTHKTVAAAAPFNADFVSQVLTDKRPGLLADGGSAYTMLINGGAQKQVFTGHQMSDIGLFPWHLYKALQHPDKTLHDVEARNTEEAALHRQEKANAQHEAPPAMRGSQYFLEALHEAGQEMWRDAHTTWQTNPKGLTQRVGAALHPLGSVTQGIIMRDISVRGIQEDIAHGVPIMYADLDGYDHASHYYGPFSAPAMDVLKGIFEKVGEVIDTIEQHPDEDYHFYMLSDHGQVPCVPFKDETGTTFKKLTKSVFGKGVVQCDLSAAHAQVYFKKESACPDLTQINQQYPAAVQTLVNQKGVGIVTAKQGNDTIILTRDGKLTVSDGKIVDGDAQKVLGKYGPPDIVAYDLDVEKRMPTAGHLVVYGDFHDTPDGAGEMVNLGTQRALGYHGEPSHHQLVGEFAHAQRDPFDNQKVMGTWQVYPQLVANITGESSTPTTLTVQPEGTPPASK